MKYNSKIGGGTRDGKFKIFYINENGEQKK